MTTLTVDGSNTPLTITDNETYDELDMSGGAVFAELEINQGGSLGITGDANLGTGSTTSTAELFVGEDGGPTAGSLTIGGTLTFGDSAGPVIGSGTIQDGSTLVATSGIVVNHGALAILTAAQATTSALYIGQNGSGQSGNVTIDGSNSQLSVSSITSYLGSLLASDAGLLLDSGSLFLDRAGDYGGPNAFTATTGGTGVFASATLTGGTTIDVSGNGDVEIGASSGNAVAGEVVIDAGYTLTANSTHTDYTNIVVGNIVDNGVISATGGSGDTALMLTGQLSSGTPVQGSGTISGTGTILIGTNAVVEISGTVAAGVTIDFADATGTLVLDDGTDFAGTIAGFVGGDTIALTGFGGQGDSSSYSSNTLSISGTNTASLVFAGASGVTFDPASGDVTCLLAGSRILTNRGPVAVEALRVGDRVMTHGGVLRPIRWIGHREVDCRRHPRPERVRPVRIAAGAFGPGLPGRTLFLSPDHAVFEEGVLIPVRHLVSGESIRQAPADHAHYFHVELDRHEVMFAEGLPVETFLDTGNRSSFANGGGVTALHPEFAAESGALFAIWQSLGFAPLRVTGPEVARVRARLQRRACQAA
jgi:hypothetical protein